jgi:hypothetical protein
MVENISYNDPVVLETFKEMIGEIPFPGLEEIIKSIRSLHNEFTTGGFHFDPKNKGRAEKIIFNYFKGVPGKCNIVFKKWYDKKKQYQAIIRTYLTSPGFLNRIKEDINTERNEFKKIEQAAFDDLMVILPEKHVSYFMYFSCREFDEEVISKWRGLGGQKDNEKINLLRQIIFNKGNEIHELKTKAIEEEYNLNEKIHDLKQDFDNQNKAIAMYRELLYERESPAPGIDNLKNQNEMLLLKESELEKIKNNGLTEFIETKKDEINAQLNEINLELEQKKIELEGISLKVKEEKEINETLEELNALKRKELAEYVDNGEKWKKALFPGKQDEPREVETPGLCFSKMSGDRYIIDVYTEFETLLEGMNFSEDNIIEIWQTLGQLKNGVIFRVGNMDEMKQIEDFFRALGHQNGKFILHADASWLTPDSPWKTKGHLYGCDIPVTFPDVIDFALKNPEIIFQVEILGANRAPIEGYLGPLLKTLPQKRKIIIGKHFEEIPINMFFFLQLDSDDYCAKPSPLLAQRLQSMNVISLDKISKEIFVPFDVLFKEE